MLEDPVWRARIARLEMRFRAHLMVSYRALADQQKGKSPGPESSILKLVGTCLLYTSDAADDRYKVLWSGGGG